MELSPVDAPTGLLFWARDPIRVDDARCFDPATTPVEWTITFLRPVKRSADSGEAPGFARSWPFDFRLPRHYTNPLVCLSEILENQSLLP